MFKQDGTQTAVDASSAPIGYIRAKSTAPDKGRTYATLKWTLTRVAREHNGTTAGYYQFGRLRSWIYGVGKTGGAQSYAYIDFSNAKLNFSTGLITDVVVYRSIYSGSWAKYALITTLRFDPTKTTSQYLEYENSSSVWKKINDRGYIDDDTTETYVRLTIKIDNPTVTISLQSEGYYQHGSAACVVINSPINEATVKFVPTT